MTDRSRIDPRTTRIDNAYYDRLGDDWWSRTGDVGGLHAMNPVRTDYFARALAAAGVGLPGARLLDLGCGGGLVAEEMARRGATVTGIDRSIPSLAVAARHGASLAAAPRYAGADAAALPFPDAAFDAVITSDFLEHVHDLDAVAREIARVVRPGGAVAFDTINRTFLSRLVVIGVMEVVARRIPRHTHDWKMFITPDELRASFGRAGLEVREIRGLSPQGNPLANLARAIRNRPITFAVTPDLRASYLGWALRK